MKNRLLLTCFLWLLYQITAAQTGSIKGRVTDKETGEALPGANVIIRSTAIGAVTDMEGNYIILNVEPGTYVLECSFISFKNASSENILVKTGEIRSINFTLEPLSIEIEGVTITARIVRDTENAIVSMQMKSASSVNAISSQEIKTNGDKTAAESLRRVSGITLEGGKYLYVRGLGDRYSRTDLNGIMIPGMDPEKNNVELDLFPSGIIENMMVYKTFSPCLPGNFAGGYVDIRTKRFPDERLLQISFSASYNTQATFNRNFKTYQGGKTDFLGFDDGTRAIPSPAQGNIPFRYQDDAQLDEITISFNKVMEPSTAAVPVNQNFSIAFGNSTKLFKKDFGFLLSYTYNHDYRYYENGENGQYTLPTSESPFLQRDLHYTDSRGINYVLWSALGSASLKLNENSNINLSLIRNQGGTASSRYQEGWNNYHEVNVQTRTLQYAQRAFFSTHLMGEHKIKPLKEFTVEWHLAYSKSKQDEPDLRFFTNIYETNNSGDTIYTIDPAKQGVPARYWRFMNEKNYDAKIDFSLPYNLMKNGSKLRFGAKYLRKDRNFSERRFDINDDNSSYHGSVPEYLADDNVGMAVPGYPEEYGIYVSDATQISNTYDSYQNLFAAYLITDQQLTRKFRAAYGLRVEATHIFLQSANPSNPTGELQNIDFLPAINLTYKPKNNINLRVAYARTIARPSFRELAPYASFEFAGDYTLIGNENLKRTLIDNVDLRFELSLKPGELVSFDVFYKGFINPIERTFVTTASNDELTFENADRADVYGIEFEIRQNLDFIPALKNFKIGFNMALVTSIVNIPEDELNIIHATDPTAAAQRSMYGQAPYIINAYLNYSASKIKLNARLVYNTTGPKLAIVVRGGTPNVYDAPKNSIDFVLRKQIGQKIFLSFKAKNLLNTKFKKYYIYRDTKYIYSNYRLGRTFSFGLSFKL